MARRGASRGRRDGCRPGSGPVTARRLTRRHPGRTPKEVSHEAAQHRAPGCRRGALLRHHLRRRRDRARAVRNTYRRPTAAQPGPHITSHRELDVRAGGRTAVVGRVAPARRRARPCRSRSGAAALEADRPRSHRCCRALQAARAPPTHGQHAGRASASRAAPGIAPGEARDRAPERLPPRVRVVVRARALRQPARLRRHAATRAALGVAHKSLPCGTKVTFKRGERSVRVPVIDRGPVRRRARVRPDRGDRPAARLPRPRRRSWRRASGSSGSASCGRAAGASRPPRPARRRTPRRARRAGAPGAAARRRAAARARRR